MTTPNTHTLANPATIAIDDTVALPASDAAEADWTLLLDRMQIGQSAKLPRLACRTLSQTIDQRQEATQQKFVIRRLVENQIRVWRIA